MVDYGTVRQLVYGSTPSSSGYSVLGKSEGLDEVLCERLVQFSESYDQQHYAAPFTPYSVAIVHFPEERYVLTEICGGWKDQMGRASRVMRSAVVERTGWRLLAGDPFLLLWLLPPIRRCLATKRHEIKDIPLLHIGELPEEVWEKLWWKESRKCHDIIVRLSAQEQKWLWHFQSQKEPIPIEIPVECDQSRLCRVLAYVCPHPLRLQMQWESFSLNRNPPAGVCFRYVRYCKEGAGVTPQNGRIPANSFLGWKIATIVRSIPDPYNYQVLARWWQRNLRIGWAVNIGFALAMLILTICLL